LAACDGGRRSRRWDERPQHRSRSWLGRDGGGWLFLGRCGEQQVRVQQVLQRRLLLLALHRPISTASPHGTQRSYLSRDSRRLGWAGGSGAWRRASSRTLWRGWWGGGDSDGGSKGLPYVAPPARLGRGRGRDMGIACATLGCCRRGKSKRLSPR
jgi:hypothetical protein